MKLAVLTCLSVLALPYSTGLFFDGGATAITAATANSAVLGVGLAAKLAGLAGGLALAGSGGSRSRSPSRTYYRSRGRSYRGKREALFFDGGATAITAATANSAVLGVGLAAKLAGLAGGLALAGGRGSSSRSNGRSYRSRGHSYRGKREALFFDGGATITAATANSALLGVAIGAKLAGLAGGLALGGSRGSSSGSSGRYRSSRYSSRGHSYRGKREALFFDGGATITAATANSALLGVAIGAKLAGLAGGLALGGSRGSSSGSSGSYRSSRYSSRGHSYRGKREAEAEAMTELLEAAFVGMEEQGTTGCFQRLFCDMSAQPSKYEDLAPMAVAVRAGASMQFQATEAADVASKLNQALEYGKVMVTYAGEPNKCETVFNQCPWSGQKMVEYIGQIEEYEQFLLASNGL